MTQMKQRFRNRRQGKRDIITIRFYLCPSVFICAFALRSPAQPSRPTCARSFRPTRSSISKQTTLPPPCSRSSTANRLTKSRNTKPDLSALKGVQLAVAVTGFETSEEKLTDEHSVGRVQPHFVAVADTHAWNFQAVRFAEKKARLLCRKIYDSEPTLEKSDKNGGKYFTWTAKDGRKAYALVIDSLIYFGNDETAIDKCLAVKRGEADSIAKAGKVPAIRPRDTRLRLRRPRRHRPDRQHHRPKTRLRRRRRLRGPMRHRRYCAAAC